MAACAAASPASPAAHSPVFVIPNDHLAHDKLIFESSRIPNDYKNPTRLAIVKSIQFVLGQHTDKAKTKEAKERDEIGEFVQICRELAQLREDEENSSALPNQLLAVLILSRTFPMPWVDMVRHAFKAVVATLNKISSSSSVKNSGYSGSHHTFPVVYPPCWTCCLFDVETLINPAKICAVVFGIDPVSRKKSGAAHATGIAFHLPTMREWQGSLVALQEHYRIDCWGDRPKNYCLKGLALVNLTRVILQDSLSGSRNFFAEPWVCYSMRFWELVRKTPKEVGAAPIVGMLFENPEYPRSLLHYNFDEMFPGLHMVIHPASLYKYETSPAQIATSYHKIREHIHPIVYGQTSKLKPADSVLAAKPAAATGVATAAAAQPTTAAAAIQSAAVSVVENTAAAAAARNAEAAKVSLQLQLSFDVHTGAAVTSDAVLSTIMAPAEENAAAGAVMAAVPYTGTKPEEKLRLQIAERDTGFTISVSARDSVVPVHAVGSDNLGKSAGDAQQDVATKRDEWTIAPSTCKPGTETPTAVPTDSVLDPANVLAILQAAFASLSIYSRPNSPVAIVDAASKVWSGSAEATPIVTTTTALLEDGPLADTSSKKAGSPRSELTEAEQPATAESEPLPARRLYF